MNWLDLVLIFIFVVAAIGGAKNGLIKTVISFVALVAGIVLAVRFYTDLGAILENVISNQTAARIISFLIILGAVVAVGAILSAILGHFVSAIGLGWINRVGGAVASLFIAMIVFGGILASIESLPGGGGIKSTILGSFTATFLVDRFLPALGALSPFFNDPTGWLQNPMK